VGLGMKQDFLVGHGVLRRSGAMFPGAYKNHARVASMWLRLCTTPG
jgi:hypothetical protein